MQQTDQRRALPSVDELLRHPQVREMLAQFPRSVAVQLVRDAVQLVRQAMAVPPAQNGEEGPGRATVEQILEALSSLARSVQSQRLQPVVNATGILLHTNLGRAPLPRAAVEAITSVASTYSNLEFDVASGRRGSRTARLVPMLRALSGAESAFVVNNNAAAVLLVLAATSAGREVIISRGELVEIGDSFRLPEIIAQSGCLLREVGTTNRTRLADYERAISSQTAALLKAHPSNFRIIGFTESVDTSQLATLAHRHGLLMLVDLGSGALRSTEAWKPLTCQLPAADREAWQACYPPGLDLREPTVSETVAAGADAVMFSGDKLLGGPQAGIIVGKKAVIDQVRRHPLARALRVGKLTLAALTAVLELYLSDRVGDIPVWALMTASPSSLMDRAHRIVARVRAGLSGADASGAPADTPPPAPGPLEPTPERAVQSGFASSGVAVEVVRSFAEVGGGSLPAVSLPSAAVALIPHPEQSRLALELLQALRLQTPPVIGRIERGRVLLDLRTVFPEQDGALVHAILAALRGGST